LANKHQSKSSTVTQNIIKLS